MAPVRPPVGGPCRGHAKIPSFSFSSLCFCSALWEQEEGGRPLPGVQPDELSREPCEGCAKEHPRLLGEPGEQPRCKVLPVAGRARSIPGCAFHIPRLGPCLEARQQRAVSQVLRWARGSGESACAPWSGCPPVLPVPFPGTAASQPFCDSRSFLAAGLCGCRKRHPGICRDPGSADRSGHARVPVPGGLCRREHAPRRACQALGLA